MKKLFFGAIAAMTLAACSQEDIDNSSTSKEVKTVNGIEYSVSARNQTRVAESYGANNLPSSFKVWAVNSSSNASFITGETITKGTDGTYAGTTEHEWDGNSYNFFASVNGDITVTDGTAAISSFTVADAAASQVDLLYASAPSQSSGSVPISFKHALSQVSFMAKNTNENITVKINSVGIGYLNNTGTYTLPSTSTSTGTETGTWSNCSGTAEYKVSLGDDGVTLSSDAAALTSGTTANILAVIPQKQSKLTVADDASSVTKNGAYFILNADITGTTTYSGNIYVPVSIDWAEGNRYIYTLTFADGDGGYRDNGSTVIGGSETKTFVGYTVTCSDYVDKTNDSDMTSEVTETETITPDIAAHVRSTEANAGNNYTSANNVQMLVKGGDTPYYGIMSFTIPAKDGYKVKKASLRLVSRNVKADIGISIYSMGEFTSENATYTNLSSAITTALSGTAVTFDMAGQAGMSFVTDYEKSDFSSDYKSLDKWINNVDITSLLPSSGNSLYLLLAKSDATKTTESQFYPLNVVSSDLTTINKNTGGSYTSADLIPQLTVTYVATE